MEAGKVELKVLNPRGKVDDIRQVAGARRLASLTSKRIGILNNGKASGEILLPFLERALKKRVSDIGLRAWSVPFAASPDVKEPKLKELAEYADGVIALTGD